MASTENRFCHRLSAFGSMLLKLPARFDNRSTETTQRKQKSQTMPGQVEISFQKAKDTTQKWMSLFVDNTCCGATMGKTRVTETTKEHERCASPCSVSCQKPTIHLRDIFVRHWPIFFSLHTVFHIAFEHESATNELSSAVETCMEVGRCTSLRSVGAFWLWCWTHNNPCSLDVVLIAAVSATTSLARRLLYRIK